MYKENESIEEVINKPTSRVTKYLGWMEANKIYEEARTLT